MNSETQFWEDLKSGRFVSMIRESASLIISLNFLPSINSFICFPINF